MPKDRPIEHILKSRHTPLNRLLWHADQIRRLTTLLHAALPDELRDHCVVANLSKGMLVLAADNAAWATRIRYLSSALLQTLKRHDEFRQVQRIQCHILPPQTQEKPRTQHRSLSKKTRELLQETATGIGDPVLKENLVKLATERSKDAEN